MNSSRKMLHRKYRRQSRSNFGSASSVSNSLRLLSNDEEIKYVVIKVWKRIPNEIIATNE